MDAQSTLNVAEKTAAMRLAGPCATEHAAPLAAAWLELLAQVDAARGQEGPHGDARSQGWAAILDFSEMTGVGLAFFEVTAAAAKALSRRGWPCRGRATSRSSCIRPPRYRGSPRHPAMRPFLSPGRPDAP